MLSRIDRYIIRELAATFFATVTILLVTVLSFRLASYFSKAASGLLAQDAIWLMIGLQAMRYLVVLTPPALLLSAVLALGRLYQDNEMVALNACGAGPGVIYRALFTLVIPMALVLTWLSLYFVPLCMDLQLELQFQARQNAEISIITPGTFRTVKNGKYVIYVGNSDQDSGQLYDIFIRSFDTAQVTVITSKRGYQKIDPRSGIRYIVLEDGSRYHGVPGSGDAKILRFQRLVIEIDSDPMDTTQTRRGAIPTTQLLDSDLPAHRAELHERFSGPLALLLLAFLAPLIAHMQPREGRYGRVVIAILIYTIYSNLLEVGYAWLANGTLRPALGLWWVHSLPLSLGVGLWLYRYGGGLLPRRKHASLDRGRPLARRQPIAAHKG